MNNIQPNNNLLLCRPDALDVRGMVVDDDPLGVEDVLRGSDWLASPWGLALTELDWDEWREPKNKKVTIISTLSSTIHNMCNFSRKNVANG